MMHGMLYWSVSVASVVLASSVSVVTNFWEHLTVVVGVCSKAETKGTGCCDYLLTLAAAH